MISVQTLHGFELPNGEGIGSTEPMSEPVEMTVEHLHSLLEESASIEGTPSVEELQDIVGHLDNTVLVLAIDDVSGTGVHIWLTHPSQLGFKDRKQCSPTSEPGVFNTGGGAAPSGELN